MSTITIFKTAKSGVEFTVSVVHYGAWDGFSDQWEMTDKHIGGVTVTNPEYLGRYASFGSRKFGIPQQCSLSELSAAYAKQGRQNSSVEAYASLQNQLLRDMNANEYGFAVNANVGGVVLLDAEPCGFCFDWSSHDNEDLETVAQQMFNDCCIDDALHNAQAAAKSILARSEALKSLIAG